MVGWVLLLASGILVGGVQAAGSSLEVVSTPTGVIIRWTPQGTSGDVLLTVSHEDAGAEVVVDWARVLRANGDSTVEVSIENLSAAENLAVQIWDNATHLPTISALTDLPAALPDRLPRENITIACPSIAPQRAFWAYPINHDTVFEPTADLHVLPSGAIAATWLAMMPPFSDYSYQSAYYPTHCVLFAASSLDGGHAFSAPVKIARVASHNQGDCPNNLVATATSLRGGTVALAVDLRDDTGDARLTIYDPTRNVVLARHDLAGVRFDWAAGSAPTPDGGMILAGQSVGSDLALWRVSVDGTVERYPVGPSGVMAYPPILSASNDRGDLAFAFSGGSGLSAVYTVSRDGGKTFSAAAPVPSPTDKQVALQDLEFSEDGTLHMTLEKRWEGNTDAEYIRVPPDGETEVRDFCGPAPDAILRNCTMAQYLRMASAGGRLWLVFERFWDGYERGWQDPDAVLHVATDSRDGGRTFSQPYEMEDHPGNRMSVPYELGVFPSGRPVMYALMFFQDEGREVAWHSIVPFFDPLAPARQLANATLAQATREERPELDSDLASVSWEDAAEPALAVSVRNTGSVTWENATLVLDDLDAEVAEQDQRPQPVTPGGILTGVFRLSEDATSVQAQVMSRASALGPPLAVSLENLSNRSPDKDKQEQEFETAPAETAEPGPLPGFEAVMLMVAIGAAFVLTRRPRNP